MIFYLQISGRSVEITSSRIKLKCEMELRDFCLDEFLFIEYLIDLDDSYNLMNHCKGNGDFMAKILSDLLDFTFLNQFLPLTCLFLTYLFLICLPIIKFLAGSFQQL